MKKIFTAALACILMISVIPASASAKATHYLKVKETGYYCDTNGKMKKSFVADYKYNNKGILKKYKSVGYNGSKKQGVSTSEYKIKNNRQVSCISVSTFDNESYKFKEVYKYKNKELVKRVYYDYNKKKKKYVKTNYQTISASSKKCTTKYFDNKGKQTYKTVDILDKKGRVKTSKDYDEKGKLSLTTKYTYNKHGDMTKSASKGSAPGSDSVFKFEYTYDKHGNAKTEIGYYNGQKFSKVVYKYKKFRY